MKHTVIRWGIFNVIILLAFLAQTTLKRFIPNLNISPNLLLIITFSIGLLRGRTDGMITGLICGLLMDTFGGGVLGYFTLIYMYIGYINGILSKVLVSDIVLLPLALCLINEACYHIYVYVFGFVLRRKFDFWAYFDQIMMPELILTLLSTIVLYGIILLINRRLDEAEKKGMTRFA